VSGSYVPTIIAAIAALFLVASGGIAFVGSDPTKIQTKLMKKYPHFTQPEALHKVNQRIDCRKRLAFICWILAVVGAGLAIYFAVADNHNGSGDVHPMKTTATSA
jgi:hypothetical protein